MRPRLTYVAHAPVDLCEAEWGAGVWTSDGRLIVTRTYAGGLDVVPADGGRPEPLTKPDIAQGKGAPGHGQLYIDGQLVGEAEFEVTTPLSLGLTGGITVGADPGAPVAPFYEPPFAFTGTIHSVTFDLSGELIKDEEAEMRRILARQ